MYYIECQVDRSDSIGIFLDLIARGHQRFYGSDTPMLPKVITFRICLPETLKYGLPADLISSSYKIYNPKYAYYVDIDRFCLIQDPNRGIIFSTDKISIWWDPEDEKFISYPKTITGKFTDCLKLGEILRYLGLPKEFFKEYYSAFQQSTNDEYVFETASDIWK